MKRIGYAAVIAAVGVLVAVPIAQAGPATKSAALVDVKFAGSPTFAISPVWVAAHFKIFRKNGINPSQILEYGSGAPLTTALVTGTSNVVCTGYERPMSLADVGQSVQLMNDLTTAPPFVMVQAKGQNFPTGDMKKTLQALKGKRLGTPGGTSGSSWGVTAAALQAAGVNPKSMTIIGVGLGATAIAAIANKSVDALITLNPDYETILAQGLGTKILDFRSTKEAGKIAQLPNAACMSKSDWIKDNADVAGRVVKSLSEAITYMKRNKAKVIPYLAKRYNLPERTMTRIYDGEIDTFGTYLKVGDYQRLGQAMKGAGVIKKVYPYNQIVATQFKRFWVKGS